MTGGTKDKADTDTRKVCLIAEVVGNSPYSFDEAISDGIKLFQNVRGVDIIGWKIKWDNGVATYRVVMKVAYDGDV